MQYTYGSPPAIVYALRSRKCTFSVQTVCSKEEEESERERERERKRERGVRENNEQH
jgi:hypothetical protein